MCRKVEADMIECGGEATMLSFGPVVNGSQERLINGV